MGSCPGLVNSLPKFTDEALPPFWYLTTGKASAFWWFVCLLACFPKCDALDLWLWVCLDTHFSCRHSWFSFLYCPCRCHLFLYLHCNYIVISKAIPQALAFCKELFLPRSHSCLLEERPPQMSLLPSPTTGAKSYIFFF